MTLRAYHHRFTAAGILLAAVSLAHCTGRAAASPPSIHLDTSGQSAAIEVRDLPEEAAPTLQRANLDAAAWTALLRVSVAAGGPADGLPAVSGTYEVRGRTVRFTPMFPLDPGRQYDVRFDPSRLPSVSDAWPWPNAPIHAVVATPAVERTPTTVVTRVYPSADTLPANQLRLYIHFSAPMGLRGGLEHIRLLDDRGREVLDPFLPFESDYWNGDRTRYTLFFDPGRVKRGILPNRQMGRALEPGKRYTLVISSEWTDGQGQPLAAAFRREFTVGALEERPLRTDSWTITPPAAGTRGPLTVDFPTPMDHGLLQRALGVARAGASLAGEIEIERAETRWRFVPAEPWAPGGHDLVVLGILEDLAGNRIGRAFEVDAFDRSAPLGEAERYLLPFSVPPGTVP